MNYFDALLLGIIEGLTEFLPVSSTGHMILASRLFRLEQTDFLSSFTVVIQLGAILAVVMLYGKTILFNKEMVKRVAAAFVPTAIIGFALYKFIKSVLLGNPWVVVGSLFIGGVIIILFETLHKQKEDAVTELSAMTYRQAVLIGVFQALAVIPGVSRSAATIIGGLSLNIGRKTIVEFSFLLAIPTMAAATALDLLKSAGSFSSDQFGVLAMGFIVSFIVAIAAIQFFLRFIQNHNFMVFGIYRILIAGMFFLFYR